MGAYTVTADSRLLMACTDLSNQTAHKRQLTVIQSNGARLVHAQDDSDTKITIFIRNWIA